MTRQIVWYPAYGVVQRDGVHRASLVLASHGVIVFSMLESSLVNAGIIQPLLVSVVVASRFMGVTGSGRNMNRSSHANETIDSTISAILA